MKIMLSLLLAASAVLSGCAVYTPTGAVVLNPVGTVKQGDDGGGRGRFCPPGQAKKATAKSGAFLSFPLHGPRGTPAEPAG